MSESPQEAARHGALVAALADLPGAGSSRLGRLLSDRSVDEAWAAVLAGSVPAEVASAPVRREWQAQGRRVDLASVAARLTGLGLVATSWHDDEHPPRLVGDIDPAPVLLRFGELPDPAGPHVAVVGTRRASSVGRELARELGAGLAAAGVVVVSGLAIGIDGAAHRGALLADATPPVAVVGSGPDVIYPRAHQDLWREVAARGALLTEAPLGARADPWRFPARNRLIAALSDLIVVVESREAGGSLLTVDQAVRRGIDVMAVPGSVRNPAAAGTNQLLADGCAPVRDVDDVLVALGLSAAATGSRRDRAPSRPLPPDTAPVFTEIDDGPTSIDEIVERTRLGVLDVCGRVEQLVVSGHVVHDGARVRRA